MVTYITYKGNYIGIALDLGGSYEVTYENYALALGLPEGFLLDLVDITANEDVATSNKRPAGYDTVLADYACIKEALNTIFHQKSSDRVEPWLSKKQTVLGDKSGNDLILSGRSGRVLNYLYAIVNGGFW